jgi:hypothetical protein
MGHPKKSGIAAEAPREKFRTGFVGSSTEKLGSAQVYLHRVPAFVLVFLHCALTCIHQRGGREFTTEFTWAGYALQRPIT